MAIRLMQLRRVMTLGSMVVLLIGLCVSETLAQDNDTPSPKVEAKAILGGVTFDEVGHPMVGAALRYYITRRVSVEPEILYLRSASDDQDFIVSGNVAVDLTDPAGRLVPYVVGGAGVIHHKGRVFSGTNFFTGVPFNVDTSYTTWSASGGIGVKVFITKRFFIAPEGRLGRQPMLRGSVGIGYVFDKR